MVFTSDSSDDYKYLVKFIQECIPIHTERQTKRTQHTSSDCYSIASLSAQSEVQALDADSEIVEKAHKWKASFCIFKNTFKWPIMQMMYLLTSRGRVGLGREREREGPLKT